MANKIGLIEKYTRDAVVQILAAESKSRVLEADAKRINLDFAGGNIVKVLNLAFDGLSDYKRAANTDITAAAGYTEFNAGDSTGRGYLPSDVGAEWETFQLAYHRAAQLKIDRADDEENAGLVVGYAVSEFIRTKVIPEIDATRFSKLAGFTNTLLGNRVEAAISANEIISKFNAAIEWLTEAESVAENQVFFVSPAVMTLVRNTTELQKKLTQDEYRSRTEGVTFAVTKYDGRIIEEVPSSRFFTEVNVGLKGYFPKATSKIISFLLVDKTVALPIVKVDDVRIFTPEQVQDFNGYKINFELYHDLFVPAKLQSAVYAHVSPAAATSKAARLNVALAAGANGKTKVTDYATLPLGLTGALYGIAGDDGFVVGEAIGDYSGAVDITVGTDFTALNGDKGYFCLVKDGKIIAVSAKYTSIPKGAAG